jgi:hypothetical protein
MYPVRTRSRLWANHQPCPVREMDGGALPRRRPADRRTRVGRDVDHQSSRCLDHHQGKHPTGPSPISSLCTFHNISKFNFPVLLIKFIRQATPYHYKDRGLIVGDAAHSQVPFYGQGLNCGLEDVRVLDYFLQECKVGPTVRLSEPAEKLDDGRLSAALAKYTETRHEDLVAICDMAMRQ